MHFVLIFGPPAVGKMTVGEEVSKMTGLPLFHNHMSIEPVLRFFPFGSPAFQRLSGGFRRKLFEEVANSDLPGMIFTLVWSLADEQDIKAVARICDTFERAGAEICLVELKADLDVRLIRNVSEHRLQEKPSKRRDNSETDLLKLEEEHKMNSDGEMPLSYRHIIIDNTKLSAEAAAREIVNAFALPVTDP